MVLKSKFPQICGFTVNLFTSILLIVSAASGASASQISASDPSPLRASNLPNAVPVPVPVLAASEKAPKRAEGGEAAKGAQEGGAPPLAIDALAAQAGALGAAAIKEAEEERAMLAARGEVWDRHALAADEKLDLCQQAMVLSRADLQAAEGGVPLPCGLAKGSSFTFTGLISRNGNDEVGFTLDLKGLPIGEGESPPVILRLRAVLRSEGGAIECNAMSSTFSSSSSSYSSPSSSSAAGGDDGRWGAAQRCEGTASDDETAKVDGLPQCEGWARADAFKGKPSAWVQRSARSSAPLGLFPLRADRAFVLTLRAGFQGFHVSVDGLHVLSFPYRAGYVTEEAASLHYDGDIVFSSLIGVSLPLHPPVKRATPLQSDHLKAPPLKEGPSELFIGILSASTYFDARRAVRETWMQYPLIRSGDVTARFFIGLHSSKQVNVETLKEREYFQDMVVLPFIDNYDLVVLKSYALCEWALEHTQAKYVIKVDDDNFVHLDRVLENIKYVNFKNSLYMGNMNRGHYPQREGKWAVTLEEWPNKPYPPYANGPGYILSRDIVEFIVRLKKRDQLRIHKMEDVTVGMWVVQYSINQTVNYVHNWRFCQFGCMENFITAHYQNPRRMLCLWEKVQQGDESCCD